MMIVILEEPNHPNHDDIKMTGWCATSKMAISKTSLSVQTISYFTSTLKISVIQPEFSMLSVPAGNDLCGLRCLQFVLMV